MQKPFLERFRRITSSGFYLPQVDGLRFVAIFLVVCIAHIPNFINKKLFDGQLIEGYWESFSLEGVFGVMLFFIISGFILGHFFARKYIHNNEKAKLKEYFIRRLTRIEPPYLVALIIFFIALVFIVKKYEFSELLTSFITSVFYFHNIWFAEHSHVLPVAWTLEIEIQFYILAPLLGLIYRVRKKELRWLIFIILILVDAVYWYNVWSGLHVFKFLHYFLCGMLIADLYVEKIKIPGPAILGFIIGLICLFSIPFVHGFYSAPGYIIKYLAMVILTYTVINNQQLSKIFSFTPVAIIGGMCYSIYLIHEQVISATGRLLTYNRITNIPLSFTISCLFLIISVLATSALYFKLIERPCMRKNWWKHFLKKNE